MRLGALLVGGVCAFALAALPASGAMITVHVFNSDFSFNPKGQPILDPTINAGDTVRWVWDEGFHDVVSVSGLAESFDSGLFTPPHAFEYTFNNEGIFPYYCSVHGADNGQGGTVGMAGIITVVPEPASALSLATGLTLLGLRRRR